jgi:hypothetical protein
MSRIGLIDKLKIRFGETPADSDTAATNIGGDIYDETIGVVTPSWTAPTLLNSWVGFGSLWDTVKYWKDPITGIVYFRGMIKDGVFVNDTNLFIMPVGYRPPISHTLPIIAYPFNSSLYVKIIANTGEIKCYNLLGNNWMSFGGVFYHTE